MKKTLLVFRIFFLFASFMGCCLIAYAGTDVPLGLALFIGMALASLVILTDLLLEGFSIRGLSAISFGLAIGALIAFLLSNSPLFEPLESDPDLAEILYLVRLALYIVTMYLATVIALRGKDEFNLVIPYVRFTPEHVEAPVVVVDTSALIDGRIVAICESRWIAFALIVPRFVLSELQSIADSADPVRKAKGRKGLEVLNELRHLNGVDIRIHESEVENHEAVDSKLVFLAHSMKARLLTMDYNLAKMAEFHHVDWLNISNLVKALNQDVSIGARLQVELVKPGKDKGQAVGYLPDGSMLVVNDAASQIGHEVVVEVDSVVPSSAGKVVFATYCATDS